MLFEMCVDGDVRDVTSPPLPPPVISKVMLLATTFDNLSRVMYLEESIVSRLSHPKPKTQDDPP